MVWARRLDGGTPASAIAISAGNESQIDANLTPIRAQSAHPGKQDS
jgi:hypothetical protein